VIVDPSEPVRAEAVKDAQARIANEGERQRDAPLHRASQFAIAWLRLFEAEGAVVCGGDEGAEILGQLLEEQHEVPARGII
jgi:hypothetical protein